ncbi:TonB-dependent receptor [Chitinophaga rhizosphaerae]|uniref:TonB-dependent receptor n=1 Tax=Chitinophaga rhizosphaerae TaxID=1864947 RepID=UPI000F8003F1|nr:TonB-dependent receptor [Chitinophaga rhizosphaerae]
MKKHFTLLCVALIQVLTGFAQQAREHNGTIRGTLTTADGQPAANITIRIDQTNRGAISNENGEYTIRNVRPGTWRIVVTAVSAAGQDKTVTLSAGETVRADFTLRENAAQLHEVTISGREVGKSGQTVAKMPIKNLENPQVYNSVSAEIMKQQGLTNYDDALRNVPGITRTWESTGRAGDGAAYYALRGFDAQPLLINGLPGITTGTLDPAGVQEIQVIKGPSGTLFGGAFYAYGGFINTITKKPYEGFGGELSYQMGSFGLNRITADVNAVLNKENNVLFRLNTAYTTENSFQDAGFRKAFYIQPTLSYQASDRLSFTFLAEVLQEERAVPPVFFHNNRAAPLEYRNVGELNLDNELSFTSNEMTIRNPRSLFQAQMTYKLSPQWTSQTVVSRGNVKANGIYTYIWDEDAGQHDNTFDQWFHNENQTISTTDIQQNFNGDFKIGNLRNRLLVGLDYFNRNLIDNGGPWAIARRVTPQGEFSYPVNGTDGQPLQFNRQAIENLLATSGANNNGDIRNSTYSAYASDLFNITPGIMVMASIRADYFKSWGDKKDKTDGYDQFAVSPKLGIVYQPLLDKVSIFANYMNAFINVDPRSLPNNGGSISFKPEKANQVEGGVKVDLLNNRLTATASVYDIRVSDRVVDKGNGNYFQGGKVKSQGFEFDLNARPVAGLTLIAGYSYNYGKTIEGLDGDFYQEPGRAYGGQGPGNLANLWVSYTVQEGALRNFGAGTGGNYGSEYKVIDNSLTGVFYLPSYLTVNAGVFYNGPRVRVNLNVNNLTNEKWYTGYWSVNPQKPVNFTFGVAYKF